MKSGASENDLYDDEAADNDEQETTSRSRPDSQADSTMPPTTRDMSESDTDTQSTTATTETDLPYIFRRNEVKAGRDNVHQFFLRDDFAAIEDDLMGAVADELSIREKDLYRLDLREAIMAVAGEHPTELASVLRDWGYEHKQ